MEFKFSKRTKNWQKKNRNKVDKSKWYLCKVTRYSVSTCTFVNNITGVAEQSNSVAQFYILMVYTKTCMIIFKVVSMHCN